MSKLLAVATLGAVFLFPTSSMGIDTDLDGIDDDRDNCVFVSNPLQRDDDLDGYGTICDADYDNNGTVDLTDFNFFLAVFGGPAVLTDHDGDGSVSLGDFNSFLAMFGGPPGDSGLACAGATPCLSCLVNPGFDDDGDGINNENDNCTDVPNGINEAPNIQVDGDGDGFGNICDADFDNSGFVDYFPDLLPTFWDAFGGPDPVVDLNADGTVDLTDYNLMLNALNIGFPGPSGLVCSASGWIDLALRNAVQDRNYLVVETQPFTADLIPEGDDFPHPVTVAISTDPTAAWRFITTAQTGEFHFVAPAGSAGSVLSFDFIVSDETGSKTATATFHVVAETSSSPAAGDRNDEVLVVYNSNAEDALSLAQYFATARGIDSSQLCAVTMPVGHYASVDQMLVERKQIVEDCICPLIPVNQRPSPCEVGPALDQLAEVSPFSHLALIRGLPARLSDTGFPAGGTGSGDSGSEEEPSLDFYLAYLLYRDEDLFCAGCSGPMSGGTGKVSTLFDEQVGGSSITRGIDVALDRFVAYGRIEAMTADRTRDLIDRTLAAEAAGFQGNVLSERANGMRAGIHLVGSNANECIDYATKDPFISGDPLSTWPHLQCRAGSTYSETAAALTGKLPGSLSTHIPLAINAGYLMGSNPLGNGQSGFNSFGTMTNWRLDDSACTPLCGNLLTAIERADCSENSTDFFQELNTDCVGVAPGFVGMQLRSFPVGFYGFYPPGWRSGDVGGNESAVPEIRSGGAYTDATFLDDRYLHFGEADHNTPDENDCDTLAGGIEPCSEPVPVYLMTTGPNLASNPIPLSGDRDFIVTVRHRNAANPGAILKVSSRFFVDGVLHHVSGPTIALDTSTNGLWVTSAPLTLTVSGSFGSEITKIQLLLQSGLKDGIEDFIVIDAIVMVDSEDPSGTNLLPMATASFDPASQNQTTRGDYAANAIDRLGAIAFWGSSSHHRTGGFAFADIPQTFRRYFDGLSLAESVISVGGGESGLIYADPILQPSIVSLRPIGESTARPASRPIGPVIADGIQGIFSYDGATVTSDHLNTRRKAVMTVLHGTANVGTTYWKLSLCSVSDLEICESQALWSDVDSGVGAVRDRIFDWVDLLAMPTVNQDVVIRLSVWNSGEEDQTLYDYLFYDYQIQ